MLPIVEQGARLRHAAFWRRDAGCIVAGDAEADEQNLAQSLLFVAGPRGKPKFKFVEWTAHTSCALPSPAKGALVAEDRGRLITATAAGFAEDRVVFADGREDPIIISALERVGGSVFLVGMRGLIAWRRDDGSWERLSGPDSALPGLEALAGPSPDEIYAVGWKGALAWIDHGRWQDVPLPTSVILTDIAVDDAGQCYACGQDGVLLRGRRDLWEVICEGETEENLWSVAWYGGRLYVASVLTLYTVEDGRLVGVKFGDDPPTSCYRLSVSDGCLFSVGREDLLRFDGQAWERIA